MAKVWNGSAWIEREQPKDQDLTDIAALSPTNNDFLQRKSGAWVNRTPAQAKTDLSLTKSDVGLANVDNTADTAKPISTAQQTALNGKEPSITSGTTGQYWRGDKTFQTLDKTAVGLANVDNTSDANKPISTPTKTFLKSSLNLNPASGIGTIRSTFPPVAVGNDAGYAAFPGVVQLPTGRLRMVWRQGTDHVNTHDGVIKTATSDDLGRTWSAATTLISDGAAPDLRDPSISISPDGTKVYLTYFKSNLSAVGQGMFFAVSTDGGATFGTSVRIDSTLTGGAITAPVVDTGTGTLYAVGYAKSGAEAQFSSWLFTSTNGGTSWSAARISNGVTDGRDYAEPWLLWQGGTNFFLTQRYGSNGFGLLKSTNSGSSWGAQTQIFTGYSGRPTTALLSTGTIVLILRSTSDGSGWFTYTKNAGTSWYPPRRMNVSVNSSLSQTYAQPIEIAYGIAYCPVGFEQAFTSGLSRLYGTYLIEGAGVSPLGDVSPDTKAAVVDDVDQILFAEDFQRPDGAIAAPWVVAQGSLNISNGMLVSGNPDATGEKAYVECRTPDSVIEADFMFNGGTQAGFGIIARYVDNNNHLVITFETLNGSGSSLFPTALNVYRYLSGTLYRWQSGAWNSTLTTATATLGGATTPALFANTWGRVRVECRGAMISIFVNNQFVTWLNDQADVGNAIGTATKHGITLNPAATFQQYCRRVLIKS